MSDSAWCEDGSGDSFLFTWPLFWFSCLLDDAPACCSSGGSFRSLWIRLRRSRFCNALDDLLLDRLYLPVCGSRGRRRRLFALGFAFGCCVVNLCEGWFAEVSFRKVSSCNCACSRRGTGGGGGGQGRPFHSAVFVGTWCFRGSALPCARGDTTGGRIGLTLFTQILKGCGRTC